MSALHEVTVTFDRAKLQELQRCYAVALQRGEESFTFEGYEVLTAYAYFLIEYLRDKLGGGE